jgi:sorbitol-6-phosphate 2-dehydrogenase
VRFFDSVSANGHGVLELASDRAVIGGEPNIAGILEAIVGYVEAHGAFPARLRVGNSGFAIGESPDDVASFDGQHETDPALIRRAKAFAASVSETPGETTSAPAGVSATAGPVPGGGVPGAGGIAPSPAALSPSVVAGRVAVVTGGAQGFGLEIATALADAGAFVFLADLNADGAQAEADKLNASHGRTCAFAVSVNVADEESVRAMIAEVVKQCGGVDLFVSNAGVLRAGSVKELSVKDFYFVTNVNYGGLFLCTKHASAVMALQNRAAAQRPAAGQYHTDIIQINSKSGLEGSNKNGAYAGSKFGGIGLVQSFAMELVDDNIKVNAVCPGNFFDGPLWSDPETGLFVQYLEAGKVPGAETVADVKRFYENKVPMKRGCAGPDVVKAILYLVDQVYETGQALPVTGGQVMLR